MDAEETWNRYCAKLEELRRQQDDSRKRRKESPAVEIINKVSGQPVGVVIPDAGAAVRVDEDGAVGPRTPVPRP